MAQDGVVKQAKKVIRVKPTVVAGTTDSGDVMFNATEIPNAVIGKGGSSKLIGFTIIDKDQESHDMSLIFMSKQTNFGTVNAAPSITDANLQAAKVLGAFKLDFSAQQIVVSQDSGSAAIYSSSGLMGASNSRDYFPMILEAESDSTSVFFTGIANEAMDYAATDDLEFVFYIEY